MADGSRYGPNRRSPTTKICNQVIVGCANGVLAEGRGLAVHAGTTQRLPEALDGGLPLHHRAIIVPRRGKAFIRRVGHIATL